jgi:hypothetical protein
MYLHKNDPIYPCNNKISNPYKVQCYGLVTANLLRTTGYDQKKTAAGCKRSEPQWVGTCFESFGRDVSGIAGRSAAKARASCRLAGSDTSESDCLFGVVREIVNSDAAPERGGRFCDQVPSKFRSRCFSGIGSVMSALETGDTLRATCHKVAGRHVRSCLEGGGLEVPKA